LSEGERLPCDLAQLPALKAFVERCNDWVEDATNYIVRKQQNRRKNEKAWRKANSAKAAELEERDRESRKVENIAKLLADADEISFDCPEISQLQERAEAIRMFQGDAQMALHHPSHRRTEEFEDLIEVGRGFNVDIPELDRLDKYVQQLKWLDHARERRNQRLYLDDVNNLIQQAGELGISDDNAFLISLRGRKQAGDAWEVQAEELLSADNVPYQQVEALFTQTAITPVSRQTLQLVDQLLIKQRQLRSHVIALVEQSKEDDIHLRPKYKEVRDLLDELGDSPNKPPGAGELEKELKRHEDWMRKGKKLFGKANAPLHILLSHMSYVEEHNRACLSVEDRVRGPAEPSSREPTPEDGESSNALDPSGRPRDIFCICRQPESGMMIMCELCHEW
jgi:histone demethylase JARID1